jgi:hypothetical protein
MNKTFIEKTQKENIMEMKKITIVELHEMFKNLLEAHNALMTSHNELVEEIKELKEKGINSSNVRDRGPSSTRDMNETDAREVMLGSLKDESHRKAAEKLGLSYGQVYSARNGYTFKGIYAEMIKSQKEEKKD